MHEGWNLLAEVLGFVSACLFLWPAVTQNMSLHRAWLMTTRFRKSKTRLGKEMAKSPTVVEAALPRWSPVDQWMLTFGALALLLSFVLKILVVLNSG